MASGFPEILLAEIFNYFELDILLLAAMPVSRHWRDQVLEHRTYWGSLSLVGHESYSTYKRPPKPNCMDSVELFMLRLSRTYERPMDVTLAWLDPTLIAAIVPHLGHIRFLRLASLVEHWEAVMQSLSSAPAPMLETLRLSFHHRRPDRPDRDLFPVLPRDLFAGQAGRLRDVYLWDVGIASAMDLPGCLGSITALNFWVTLDSPLARLPNIFRTCRQLKTLEMTGHATLDETEFHCAEPWARGALANIVLAGLYPETNVRQVLYLPLVRTARILLSNCGEASVVFLAQTLGPRVSVDIPPLTPLAAHGELPFDVHFRPFEDTSAGERVVSMTLVATVPQHPNTPAIMAFRNPTVCDSIVGLTVFLRDLHTLVGQEYLAELRALEKLDIALSESADCSVWPEVPKQMLSCPRLERVVLRCGSLGGTIVVDAAVLVQFAQNALADAILPLALDIHGITLQGSLTAFGNMFTSTGLIGI